MFREAKPFPYQEIPWNCKYCSEVANNLDIYFTGFSTHIDIEIGSNLSSQRLLATCELIPTCKKHTTSILHSPHTLRVHLTPEVRKVIEEIQSVRDITFD